MNNTASDQINNKHKVMHPTLKAKLSHSTLPFDEFPIVKGVNGIGRASTNTIFFQREQTVSNYHAAIEYDGERVFLQDLNSLNKTQLLLRPGAEQIFLIPNKKYELVNGSKIIFGSVPSQIIIYNSPKPQSSPSLESHSNTTSSVDTATKVTPVDQNSSIDNNSNSNNNNSNSNSNSSNNNTHTSESTSNVNINSNNDDFVSEKEKQDEEKQEDNEQSLDKPKESHSDNEQKDIQQQQEDKESQQKQGSQNQFIDKEQLDIIEQQHREREEIERQEKERQEKELKVKEDQIKKQREEQEREVNERLQREEKEKQEKERQEKDKRDKEEQIKKQKEQEEEKRVAEQVRKEKEENEKRLEQEQIKKQKEEEEEAKRIEKEKVNQQLCLEKERIALEKKQQQEQKEKEEEAKREQEKKEESEREKQKQQEEKHQENDIESSPAPTTGKKATKNKKEEQQQVSQEQSDSSQSSNKTPRKKRQSALIEQTETLTPTSSKRKSIKLGLLDDTSSSGIVGSGSSQTSQSTPSPMNIDNNRSPSILFSLIPEEFIKQTTKDIVGLGGVMAESVRDCTHLICDELKRSKKVLESIALGKIIVTSQWIQDSKKAGHFVDETPFHLLDKKAEKEWSFNLEKSLSNARSHPAQLYKGTSFFITANSIPPKDFLEEMITHAGGKVLDSLTKVVVTPDTKVVVLCSPDKDKKNFKKWKDANYYLSKGDFILLSILSQTFDLDNNSSKL
ncbi:hypothetical protein CYY_002809 [Polysphondylium violaceum]|uniref:Mediator of DNA damage checkpoint protein 1 n=1 Tax=Polysphondylium violaceum TaxID=133409 RepID=A0A8J4PVQ1_9MYCE|nr:hypothetical protein CYY_002809 [Polysphondylium violaceum]